MDEVVNWPTVGAAAELSSQQWPRLDANARWSSVVQWHWYWCSSPRPVRSFAKVNSKCHPGQTSLQAFSRAPCNLHDVSSVFLLAIQPTCLRPSPTFTWQTIYRYSYSQTLCADSTTLLKTKCSIIISALPSAWFSISCLSVHGS